MSEIPQYAVIGSVAGAGMLTMQDGSPLEVVALRLVLKPLDADESISILSVLGREDADLLITALQDAANQVRYVAEQTTDPNNKEEVSK